MYIFEVGWIANNIFESRKRFQDNPKKEDVELTLYVVNWNAGWYFRIQYCFIVLFKIWEKSYMWNLFNTVWNISGLYILFPKYKRLYRCAQKNYFDNTNYVQNLWNVFKMFVYQQNYLLFWGRRWNFVRKIAKGH